MTNNNSIRDLRMKISRLLTAGVLAGGLLGCGTTEAAGPLVASGPAGRVRFVNVITDAVRGRVNVSLEGLPFGVDLTYQGSAPASLPAPSTAPYAAVLAGSRTFVLKRTVDTTVTVASLPFTITANQDLTVYAIGGAGGSAVTGFTTTDDNTVPSATQVRLRVVNLSPTAGAVDVFITAVGADLSAAAPSVSNLAYKTASSYLMVAPGTYQVRAVPAGTAASARSSSVSINLASLVVGGAAARTIVLADNSTGGTPLRAFALTDQ